jgi:hemolysin activation/secretion protein
VDVRLDGDIGPSGTQVLRFLRQLTEVTPRDQKSLERWMLLAQEIPGIALHAVLRPTADPPGAVTLVAQVQRAAFSGLLAADNRAFNRTGPAEGVLVLDGNSFTSLGEKTEVTLYHASGNTQNFGQAASEFYIGGSGLKVRVYAGSGRADPSEELRAIGYHGVTTTFGAALLYPVIRSRQQTLNVGLYFDGLQSNIDTGPPTQRALTSRDDLRVVRLGADYALQDIWLGSERGALNSLFVRLSQGIAGLGSSRNNDPLLGRAGERVNFSKASFEATRTQTLLQISSATSIAAQALFAGQISGDVLPPAEKFYLGGLRFNRGYYSGEVTGDNALVAAFELQLNTAFSFEAFGRALEIGAQPYLFYDWGQTWENQSVDPNRRLRSAGAGVRMNLTQYTEFDLEGVWRLSRKPQPGANAPTLGADGVFWRVVARF